MTYTSLIMILYSGSRDQEDRSRRPAQANSSPDPISKITNTELAEWLKW
jgi:hypothetical protein